MSAQNQKFQSTGFRDQALSKVVVDRGTPYQITDKDLEDLRVLPQKHSGHFVSDMQATKELHNYNALGRDPTSDELAAIARVRAALSIKDWHPDVAIKTFHDLDTILFDGRLRGNVCVCWTDHRINYVYVSGSNGDPKNIRGNNVNPTRLAALDKLASRGQKELTLIVKGVTRRSGYPLGQCCIMLNAESILPEGKSGSPISWGTMWWALLHEMCHAYDRVRTKEGDGHGKHFGTRLAAVKGRWNKLFGRTPGFIFGLNGSRYDRFLPSELSGRTSEVVSGTD